MLVRMPAQRSGRRSAAARLDHQRTRPGSHRRQNAQKAEREADRGAHPAISHRLCPGSLETKPSRRGFARRSLSLVATADHAGAAGQSRFMGRQWHRESGGYWPAMICRVDHVGDGHVAVHQTYLNPLDPAVKVALDPRKRCVGPIKGAAVQLAPAAATMAIAEGVENRACRHDRLGDAGLGGIVGKRHRRTRSAARRDRARRRYRCRRRPPTRPGSWGAACRPPLARRGPQGARLHPRPRP